MRDAFSRDMATLSTYVTEMGAMCESAIASAMKGLLEGDRENAARAIMLEEEINKRESDVETLCLKLLLRQQPVARDLRQVSSALKMVTDMERIGDQAADIAEIASLGNTRPADSNLQLKAMGIAAINMVTGAVSAYVAQDIDEARGVIVSDDKVDDMFDIIKRDLTIMLISEPGSAEHVLDLLMVAKYLERIADHAVNIAEWVIFAVTGRHAHEFETGEDDG